MDFGVNSALLRYPGDHTRIFKLAVTAEIGCHCNFLSDPDVGQLRGCEITPQKNPVKICYFEKRFAGSGKLTALDIFAKYRALTRELRFGIVLSVALYLFALILDCRSIARDC